MQNNSNNIQQFIFSNYNSETVTKKTWLSTAPFQRKINEPVKLKCHEATVLIPLHIILRKPFPLILFFIQVNILFFCATLKASRVFMHIHLYMNLYGYQFKWNNIIMHSPAIFTRYLLLYPDLCILCQFGLRENIICKIVCLF